MVSDSDSIMCAWIEGTARRLVTDTTVTDADAMAELKALAAGRADLLAEVAGVSLGFSGDEPTKYVNAPDRGSVRRGRRGRGPATALDRRRSEQSGAREGSAKHLQRR